MTQIIMTLRKFKYNSNKVCSSVLCAILFAGVEYMNVEHGVEISNDFQLEKSSYEQSGDASLIL